MPRVAQYLRQKLFAGFFALFPIALTIWIAIKLLAFLDGIIGKYITQDVPGLGLLALLLLLILTGAIVTSYAGRKLFRVYDALLSRVPLARMVYVGSRQLLEALSLQGSRGFQKVVLVEYPRRGIYSIGFVTKDSSGEVQALTREHVSNVFIPTTPNPTSGFLLLVPKAELVPLTMTVEDGIKLIVSGGLITPEVRAAYSVEEPPALEPAERDAGGS